MSYSRMKKDDNTDKIEGIIQMKNTIRLLLLVLIVASPSLLAGGAIAKTPITQYQDQSSSASVEPARMKGQPGIAVVFEGTDDLHYYATPEAAPAPGMELKVSAEAPGIMFGPVVYPAYSYFNDVAKGKIEVYVGDFKVFIPVVGNDKYISNVTVTIKGIACTSQLCLAPFTKTVSAQIDLSPMDSWPAIDFKAAPSRGDTTEPTKDTAQTQPQTTTNADTGLSKFLDDYKESETDEDRINSTAWFFLLAVLAGLSINIMPCVLPVIPLIIMRLVGQAKESGPRRVALGFSFCGGIILFFATFAVISAVIKLSTGVALDLNSIYRNPAAVITLFLFIVFFALVLLDILTITLPGSVAGKQGGSSGFAGSIGMGFFAGILSTPCSGAIIGAVLVWAQTQPLAVSSTALVLMGVGMALPYAVLISIPKLLDYVPKPGTWMEIFKKTGGFLLLIIAAKFMLAGLTKDHMLNVLLYGVIFAFAVWMWGTWVTFSTPKAKKWVVRGIAAIIAVVTGFWLLPAPLSSQIDWQKYDPAVVQNALEDGNPVLLKFTADWCTNCKVVDKNVYQDPGTATFLAQKGFVAIKADTTQEAYQATVDYKAI
ncbi:MAG: protein-disulfide reductase DsbD family protein, partial [Planctomycetota bacterium]